MNADSVGSIVECGNCGGSEWVLEKDALSEEVWVICRNCNTPAGILS